MINEIQVGSYNELLNRLLSMKGGPPAPTLAPEILAAFVLENDRPEWAFLKGEHLGVGAGLPAFAVGNLSFWSIANPVGSGALIVIEGFFLESDNNQALFMEIQAGAPPAGPVLSKSQRDTRSILGAGSTGLVAVTSQGNNGVSLLTTTHIAVRMGQTSTSTITPCPIVLSPGFRLVAEASLANSGFGLTCLWRERILDPAEI